MRGSEREKEWHKLLKETLLKRAKKLGLSDNLYLSEIIVTLLERVDILEDKVQKLEEKLST